MIARLQGVVDALALPVGALPAPVLWGVAVLALVVWARGTALERRAVAIQAALAGGVVASGVGHLQGLGAPDADPFVWGGWLCLGAGLGLAVERWRAMPALALVGLGSACVWAEVVAEAAPEAPWLTLWSAIVSVCVSGLPWVYTRWPRWTSAWVAVAFGAWALEIREPVPLVVAWVLGALVQILTGPDHVVLHRQPQVLYGRDAE